MNIKTTVQLLCMEFNLDYKVISYIILAIGDFVCVHQVWCIVTMLYYHCGV